ncbi:MAG: hypothetical protein KGH98_01695 [Candidatus Micrarchaeota archaeon]|nr:hypothetical protein [Candidatus Micrarchaeota archaeon]
MELSERSKRIIRDGSIKLRVTRSGMIQQITFKVRRVPLGTGATTLELYFDRVIDAHELQRLADETGLPVHADKIAAYPAGTSAKDYISL